MKLRILSVLLATLVLHCGAAIATESKMETPAKKEEAKVYQPRLRNGAEIVVKSYDPKTDTFLVILNKSPEVGPNYAKPQALFDALKPEDDFKTFMTEKRKLYGNIKYLKTDLPLVND